MSTVAPGWEGSGSVHRQLVPHPWDSVAARIFPGAQTVSEAEAKLREREVAALVREVADLRREARMAAERVDRATDEGNVAQGRLVALIGEDAARDELGDDWNDW